MLTFSVKLSSKITRSSYGTVRKLTSSACKYAAAKTPSTRNGRNANQETKKIVVDPEWKPALDLPKYKHVPTHLQDKIGDIRWLAPKTILQRQVQLGVEDALNDDGRKGLVDPNSSDYIIPGSVVLVEYKYDYSAESPTFFCGILLDSVYKANMSSLLIRSQIMGSSVEIRFPIYAPTVQKIHVLQMASKPRSGKITDPAFYLRESPEKAIVEWKDLEKMASSFKTQKKMDSDILSLNLD